MKTKVLTAALLALAFVFACTLSGFAAESSAQADLQELVTKIKARLSTGGNTATALAPELAEFDALRAKYKGVKTDEAAQIVVMQASLYAQVLKDDDKALALYEQLKTDYVGTKPGGEADLMIAAVKRQQEANKTQRALAVGSTFPEFSETDLSGAKLSLSSFKGKVVLLDFWATWCGPCITELPHVLDAYRKHHAAGFEIIGISLDRAEARQKLIDFTQTHQMPWAQIFDGQHWKSKLAVKYGVNSIPATFLLDADGKIVAKDLRGPALEAEVARLLAKK